MRLYSYAVVFLWFISSCGGIMEVSELKFDSAHSVLRTASIENAKIIVRKSVSLEVIESEIISQLKYSTGLLNGEQSVADMQDIKIDVHTYESIADDLQLVLYDVELKISLPKKHEKITSLNFFIPQRGDADFLNMFFHRLGKICVKKNSGHVVTASRFWYYYRPQNCQIMYYLDFDAFKMKVNLKPAAEITTKKYPEYNRVWEDSALNAVLVFGRNRKGYSNSDAGYLAYIDAFNKLITTYGQPKSVFPAFSSHQLGLGVDNISMQFETPKGEMNVRLMIIDDISKVGKEFWKTYNASTAEADFIAYNGHSGYGKNIKKLMGKGKFTAGQYKLFLLNGCISYSYVGKQMFDLHSKINNGEAGSKYVDVISNAMPAYFHHNSLTSLVVLHALYDQTKNYHEILSGFPEVQRANVIGEEDNVFVPSE